MNVYHFILYTGIFVFAATGALKARTHRMDIFGGAVLAFATAYGGGTVRDLLIGAVPVNWINDYLALGLVLGGVIIVSFLKSNLTRFRKTIFITDAIGLGMFTAAGIEHSLSFGINNGYSVVMGVVTATFGGLVADIICSEKPELLKKGELYATASAIGGLIYVLLKDNGFNGSAGLMICVIIVVGIRILSRKRKIELPEM